MADPVYKTVEITGTSTTDVGDAVKHGIEKAALTVRNLDWFEVVGVRGTIGEGRVTQFQVTMKVGFRLE